ncbi:COP9 signalosome complex subunit 4 [Thozetella sp. PMI_491]|nr:COP9 signalosome complex subunit 4 [Thozetella sp. PMI_491]
MASPKVAEALARATELADPAAALKAVLANIKSLSSQDAIALDLKATADAILEASLGVVPTRALLGDFLDTYKAFPSHELWIEVGQHAVEAIGASPALASSLLDQAAAIRETTATAHENNEDFLAAAKVLAEIPLDAAQRRVPDHDKAAIWIRIVRNYLEEDDSTAAEAFLNKLRNIVHTITDQELILHYKLSNARIQDGKRQFLAAAQSYHDISHTPVVAEEERLHTLSMAIKCAILAPAGPPRSRVLNRLYKDERSADLPEYGMLEKMFLDRLLAPAEADKFAQGLAPHQKATTADGSTVLAKAVVEHNLLGASRLYRNIPFDALALLLGLDPDRAEDTTARMIEQGRLRGWIDQIDGIVYFEPGEPAADRADRAEATVFHETHRWDANVQTLAEGVEALTDALQTEFPDFVAAQGPQPTRAAA